MIGDSNSNNRAPISVETVLDTLQMDTQLDKLQPAPPKKKYAAFEGGGIKGVAYGGAMKAFDKAGTYDDIEVCIGSSAGALTAFLVSTGLSGEQFAQVSRGIPASDLKDPILDSWLGVTAGGSFTINALRGAWSGCASGDNARALLQNFIYQLTGDSECTFQELEYFRLFGTTNPNEIQVSDYESYLKGELDIEPAHPEMKQFMCAAYSVDDRRDYYFDSQFTPDVVVADALYCSMAFPFVFRPVKIRQKDPNAPYFNNGQHFQDGGILDNLPIRHLNQKIMDEESRFQKKGTDDAPLISQLKIGGINTPPSELKYEEYSPHLLGFGLCSSKNLKTLAGYAEYADVISPEVIDQLGITTNAQMSVSEHNGGVGQLRSFEKGWQNPEQSERRAAYQIGIKPSILKDNKSNVEGKLDVMLNYGTSVMPLYNYGLEAVYFDASDEILNGLERGGESQAKHWISYYANPSKEYETDVRAYQEHIQQQLETFRNSLKEIESNDHRKSFIEHHLNSLYMQLIAEIDKGEKLSEYLGENIEPNNNFAIQRLVFQINASFNIVNDIAPDLIENTYDLLQMAVDQYNRLKQIKQENRDRFFQKVQLDDLELVKNNLIEIMVSDPFNAEVFESQLKATVSKGIDLVVQHPEVLIQAINSGNARALDSLLGHVRNSLHMKEQELQFTKGKAAIIGNLFTKKNIPADFRTIVNKHYFNEATGLDLPLLFHVLEAPLDGRVKNEVIEVIIKHHGYPLHNHQVNLNMPSTSDLEDSMSEELEEHQEQMIVSSAAMHAVKIDDFTSFNEMLESRLATQDYISYAAQTIGYSDTYDFSKVTCNEFDGNILHYVFENGSKNFIEQLIESNLFASLANSKTDLRDLAPYDCLWLNGHLNSNEKKDIATNLKRIKSDINLQSINNVTTKDSQYRERQLENKALFNVILESWTIGEAHDEQVRDMIMTAIDDEGRNIICCLIEVYSSVADGIEKEELVQIIANLLNQLEQSQLESMLNQHYPDKTPLCYAFELGDHQLLDTLQKIIQEKKIDLSALKVNKSGPAFKAKGATWKDKASHVPLIVQIAKSGNFEVINDYFYWKNQSFSSSSKKGFYTQATKAIGNIMKSYWTREGMDEANKTALHYLCENASIQSHLDTINLFINDGGQNNISYNFLYMLDDQGMTPLHYLIQNQQLQDNDLLEFFKMFSPLDKNLPDFFPDPKSHEFLFLNEIESSRGNAFKLKLVKNACSSEYYNSMNNNLRALEDKLEEAQDALDNSIKHSSQITDERVLMNVFSLINDQDGDNLLIQAIKENDLVGLNKYLSYIPDMYFVDVLNLSSNGMTPLYFAIGNSEPAFEIIASEFVLRKNLNSLKFKDAGSYNGEPDNPFLLAARIGDFNLINKLMQLKIDGGKPKSFSRNQKDVHSKNPLHYMFEHIGSNSFSENNLAALTYFLTEDYNYYGPTTGLNATTGTRMLQSKDDEGKTPIHYLLETAAPEVIVQVLQMLQNKYDGKGAYSLGSILPEIFNGADDDPIILFLNRDEISVKEKGDLLVELAGTFETKGGYFSKATTDKSYNVYTQIAKNLPADSKRTRANIH